MMRKATYLLGLLLFSLTSVAHQPTVAGASGGHGAAAQARGLHDLQQDFVDLRFGMFIHFNMPTFQEADWPDPQAPASSFNPTELDCRQWAKAAKSAGMTYGCLTTKHHSGFCIWDTKTTDYNVMNSPLRRDVVKEYTDAFRKEGLKTMLYYSILDTHHDLRPHHITRRHIQMIKDQLTELLTNYGEITALIIDGWDAPWSRISYDDVPFEDIYRLIKRLQPNCLVMDLNAAKYPREALFYTDIKSYEQGAGQKIDPNANRLPALACLPLQRTWFWKQSFPNDKLKSPEWLVNENINPYGKAHCNFILNVAPNNKGLIDDNALKALKEIGQLYKERGHVADVEPTDAQVISQNIAKNQPAYSSWSDDYAISDFGNDDDFGSCWHSNPAVANPWYAVELDREKPFNMVVLTAREGTSAPSYTLSCRRDGKWVPVADGKETRSGRVSILRFPTVWGDAVRVSFSGQAGQVSVAELGVYNERR